MEHPAPATSPLRATDRAELLDALRGFALFGVCLANLYGGFALWGEPGAVPKASLPTAATDGAAAFLIRALVEGKFYSLFSLLFGIGFAVQLQRATARGDGQLRGYRRRLWVLLGIGLAHLLFIWPGDILAFYALVGWLLVRLRHLPDRAIFRWVGALLLLPVALWAVFWLGGGWQAAVPLTPAGPFYRMGEALDKPLGLTSFYAVVANSDWVVFMKTMRSGIFYRAGDLLFQWRVCKVLAMFLLGLWAGRHQLFRHPEAHGALLRRVAAGGLALGLAASLLNAWLDTGAAYQQGLAPGLARAALYALGGAPLGRMALSCYLGQSLIALFLFTGLGLGWVGRVGPTLLWPLALSIVGGQLLACRWWLRRFEFGPAEWLWRSLSYGQRQPLRRALPAPTAG